MGSNNSYAGGQSHQVPGGSQQVDQIAGNGKSGVGGSPHLRGFLRSFRPVLGEEVSPSCFAQYWEERFRQVVLPSIGRRGFARWIVTNIYYKSDILFYFIFFMHFIFLYILSKCITHYIFYMILIHSLILRQVFLYASVYLDETPYVRSFY